MSPTHVMLPTWRTVRGLQMDHPTSARHALGLIRSRPHRALATPARRQPVLVPRAWAQTSMDQVHGARTPGRNARGFINKPRPISLPLFSFSSDPKTLGEDWLLAVRIAPSILLSGSFVVIGMGLLDKLWDDTVAGPQPDTGLGRLRKLAARPAAVKINGDRRR